MDLPVLNAAASGALLTHSGRLTNALKGCIGRSTPLRSPAFFSDQGRQVFNPLEVKTAAGEGARSACGLGAGRARGPRARNFWSGIRLTHQPAPADRRRPAPRRNQVQNNHQISIPASLVDPELEQLVQRARALIDAAKAPLTRKAYASDWRDFEGWCAK